ncbi:hypothetical protein EES44_18335 [Streptomyces sp. ADI96-15]|nr:hypothetical protein EES44_18335 [Streptomyces sp. ADI96-15]
MGPLLRRPPGPAGRVAHVPLPAQALLGGGRRRRSPYLHTPGRRGSHRARPARQRGAAARDRRSPAHRAAVAAGPALAPRPRRTRPRTGAGYGPPGHVPARWGRRQLRPRGGTDPRDAAAPGRLPADTGAGAGRRGRGGRQPYGGPACPAPGPRFRGHGVGTARTGDARERRRAPGTHGLRELAPGRRAAGGHHRPLRAAARARTHVRRAVPGAHQGLARGAGRTVRRRLRAQDGRDGLRCPPGAPRRRPPRLARLHGRRGHRPTALPLDRRHPARHRRDAAAGHARTDRRGRLLGPGHGQLGSAGPVCRRTPDTSARRGAASGPARGRRRRRLPGRLDPRTGTGPEGRNAAGRGGRRHGRGAARDGFGARRVRRPGSTAGTPDGRGRAVGARSRPGGPADGGIPVRR